MESDGYFDGKEAGANSSSRLCPVYRPRRRCWSFIFELPPHETLSAWMIVPHATRTTWSCKGNSASLRYALGGGFPVIKGSGIFPLRSKPKLRSKLRPKFLLNKEASFMTKA